jgi:hypothetical protein
MEELEPDVPEAPEVTASFHDGLDSERHLESILRLWNLQLQR